MATGGLHTFCVFTVSFLCHLGNARINSIIVTDLKLVMKHYPLDTSHDAFSLAVFCKRCSQRAVDVGILKWSRSVVSSSIKCLLARMGVSRQSANMIHHIIAPVYFVSHRII